MYPYIHIVLPSYTVMAIIGSFFAVCVVYFRLDSFCVEFSSFLIALFYCIIGGFVGSKLLFVITRIPWLLQNFSAENCLFLLPTSGFVYYGGLFGVIIALIIATKKDENLRRKLFGVSTPAIPLFHVFGRIGCFLAGCCYGKTMSKPIQLGVLELSRIPVQLIESIAELIIFMIIMIVQRRNEKVDVLKIYLILYAVIRFIDEFLRGDEVRGMLGGLSTAQWISIGIVLFYVLKQADETMRRAKLPRSWNHHNKMGRNKG